MGIVTHLRKYHPSMVLCFSESRKFIYFKVTKTAGTSIYRKIIRREVADAKVRRDHQVEYDYWISNLTEDKLKDYFKFVFVRNPWDRIVSLYFYFNFNKKCSFENFVINELYESNQNLILHSMPQYTHAYLNKKKFVDFIGKFENLDKDWSYVSKKINVSKKLPLSNETEHDGYRNYYNNKTKNLIARKYKSDIELFEYKF